MKTKLNQVISGVFKGIGLACLTCLLYLLSCSGTPANKENEPFVKQFEKEVGVDVENVLIYFTSLKRPAVGRCFPGLKVIQLDLKYYKQLSTIEKKALVFHELGHCVCSIYIHAKEGTFCGRSLMVPAMMNKWCYDKFWDVYIQDLRKRCK